MAKGFLIDQDGVIYVENQVIPGADKFIKQLQKQEIPFTFMTNNSQRSPLMQFGNWLRWVFMWKRKTCIHLQWQLPTL